MSYPTLPLDESPALPPDGAGPDDGRTPRRYTRCRFCGTSLTRRRGPFCSPQCCDEYYGTARTLDG